MLHFQGVFSFHHWTKRGEPVFIPGEAAANLARAADRTT
jgi:hypothetical protein